MGSVVTGARGRLRQTPEHRADQGDGPPYPLQFLGTDVAEADCFGRPYLDDPTEVVQAGSTEAWLILNLTGDTHPVHFHLVNVEVLSRQPFDADGYAGRAPTLTGPAYAPDGTDAVTRRCSTRRSSAATTSWRPSARG